MSVKEYFSSVETLLAKTPFVASTSLSYEERPPTAGLIMGTLIFTDGTRLDFKEILITSPTPWAVKYAYNYRREDLVIFRYNNTTLYECPLFQAPDFAKTIDVGRPFLYDINKKVNSMAFSISPEVIPLQADTNGVIRVGGTRVTLETVIAAFSEGAAAEEIVQQYPSLKLADVYSVIGYYLRRSPEVESYLQHRKAQAQVMRQQNEWRYDPQGLRDRLLTRRARQG